MRRQPNGTLVLLLCLATSHLTHVSITGWMLANHEPIIDNLSKGQVIQATFSCNLWCNIVAKFCCPYYHPHKQLVKHQNLLPKVEPSSTSCNMLLQLATLKFVVQQVACGGGLIRATKLCNLQSNSVVRQVARKCCPYYLTLKGDAKICYDKILVKRTLIVK